MEACAGYQSFFSFFLVHCQGVEVTDFSGSWADGLALCALLNSLCPGEFPLDKMSEDDRKVNLDLAFGFAT